jgi:hypothetical protein
MAQASEVDRWPLRATLGSPHVRWPDRQQVREIVGQVGAEVWSEVRAGTWEPPATLSITSRPLGSWAQD